MSIYLYFHATPENDVVTSNFLYSFLGIFRNVNFLS